jgi:hypothetical protein
MDTNHRLYAIDRTGVPVWTELQERVERVFDEVFIALAELSGSVQEYDELAAEYEYSDAWPDIQREHMTRYDAVATRMRERFTRLRR